jgi:tRNA nucleotidyltransferase (CCA-adding enzyme)
VRSPGKTRSSTFLSDTAPRRRLPRALVAALEPAVAAARAEGIRVAIVGGVVRDRLLKRPLGADVDLVVEGDALAVAHRVLRSAGDAVRVRTHERFGTATLEGSGGFRVDLASSRREIYRRPGALPEVSPAPLEEDLARRDFTVNAMAWELQASAGPTARLLDPAGGMADLQRGLLRILHPASFEDDPTRMLRAVRYASRLGFRLASPTRRRLAAALAAGALNTVSGDRIRRELERTFAEPGATRALRIASSLGVLQAIHVDWAPSRFHLAAVARSEALARRVPGEAGRQAWAWMIPLLVSAAGMSARAREELATRLALSGQTRRIFERWPEAVRGARGHESVSREERLADAALAPAGGARREAERRILAPPLELTIRGADLVGAGIPAGPPVGRALVETRRARQEGRISPGEELAFAIAAARHGEDE